MFSRREYKRYKKNFLQQFGTKEAINYSDLRGGKCAHNKNMIRELKAEGLIFVTHSLIDFSTKKTAGSGWLLTVKGVKYRKSFLDAFRNPAYR